MQNKLADTFAHSNHVPDIKEAFKRFSQILKIVIAYTAIQIVVCLFISTTIAIIAICLCAYLSAVYFLRNKLSFGLAKFLYISGVLTCILLSTYLQGTASMSYMYILPLIPVVALMLEKKPQAYRELAFYYTAFFLVFIVICCYPFKSMIAISDFQAAIFWKVNIISALLYTLLFVFMLVKVENEYHKALTEQIANAKESIRVRNNFLSNMGYEIRTPLNGIVGAANYLERNITGVTQLEYVNIIKFCGQHILGLTNDLIDHEQIEAGNFTINENQVNLKQLLQQNCGSFVNEMHEKKLDFKVHIDESLDVEVVVDDLRLIQVINHLLSNALKFTEQGYIKLDARCLNKKETKMQLYCSIEDTGIGISKENQQKIFNSFAKVATNEATPKMGAGLGLSIAQSILHLMGSKLMVESAEQKGSIFYFTLQLPTVHSQKVNDTITSAYVEYNSSISLSGLKILVAEDNKLTMLLTTRVLQEADAVVVATLNGRATLDKLKEENDFHLILLDLNMPEMSGYEVMNELKNLYPHIPTLAFTANLLNNDTYQSLLRQGFADCVLKPFEPEELLTTVKRFAIKKSDV